MSNSGLKKRVSKFVKTIDVSRVKLEVQSDELDALISESSDEIGEDFTSLKTSFEVAVSDMNQLLIELQSLQDELAHYADDAVSDEEDSYDE